MYDYYHFRKNLFFLFPCFWQVSNCNKFWFQPFTEMNEEFLTKIQLILQSKLKRFENILDLKVGSLVAAPYAESPGDEELYFRAQVLERLFEKNTLFFTVRLNYKPEQS
jgi:hypothetical protein